jgi:pilus assembly protein Flp/PilA
MKIQQVLFILKSLIAREDGQDLVEYALVVALIALGATAAMSQLGTGISQFFVMATTTLQSS